MVRLAAAILTFGVLYLIARANYLLYHALVEIFSVVVAFLIFAISWLVRDREHDSFPSAIGVGYAFVGLLDITHTIAYRGMGIFAQTGANPATQLWISARWLEAVTLLTAPFVHTIRARTLLWWTYGAFFGLVLLAIFWWKVFPICYVEGSGLTTFKIGAEYGVIGVLVLTLLLLRKHSPQIPPVLARYLSYAIVATIVSEFCFTLYVDVYDLANFAGHLVKVASYYLLFCGIVERCIREPLANLYYSLQKENMRLKREASLDSLTGLFNRGAALLLIEAKLRESRVAREPFSLMMIDIDHFKQVNDTHGHQIGDAVLRELGNLILGTVRSGEDIVGRYGGEEFILAMGNTDAARATAVAERIRQEVAEHIFASPCGKPLKVTVSVGVVEARRGEPVEEIIRRADEALYQAKARGRNRAEVMG
ncbi:MAG: GGDEF domain-containing protein [Thermoanaerobacteraceae bacterium]|nr:GGDEF domain-containing protein [Thermoanaerobacteraceae bacterium]